MSAAGEGYCQAAFLENDPKMSENYLLKAQELYLIDGQGERGISNLKKYAKQQLEDFENTECEDEAKMKRIINLYKSIYG